MDSFLTVSSSRICNWNYIQRQESLQDLFSVQKPLLIQHLRTIYSSLCKVSSDKEITIQIQLREMRKNIVCVILINIRLRFNYIRKRTCDTVIFPFDMNIGNTIVFFHTTFQSDFRSFSF